MEKIPEHITVCTLECVILPDGEIISNGITLGSFDEFKKFLTKKMAVAPPLTPIKAEGQNDNP